MSKGGLDVKSVQRAQKSLEKFISVLDIDVQDQLDYTAGRIREKAIALTPYKSGQLEASVYVNVVGNTIEAGANAYSSKGYDYAPIQHEDTSFNHPIKGQAHYISKPFNQEIYNFKRRIKRRLDKAYDSG